MSTSQLRDKSRNGCNEDKAESRTPGVVVDIVVLLVLVLVLVVAIFFVLVPDDRPLLLFARDTIMNE